MFIENKNVKEAMVHVDDLLVCRIQFHKNKKNFTTK